MQTDDLFNDPNYGFVLCFLEKFRSILNLPKYSYELLEKHLINSQQRIPARLIDFHFLLLKRISRAKNAHRENFETIISRFIARFDSNDSQQITTHGYLQADIHLKLRILKNLLESQFDFNYQFQKTFLDQTSNELNSVPIGRDRFGVSYWLFIDNFYVRLFREDVDINRTWTIICRTRDELEKFIRLLLSDSIFQNKFHDDSIFEQRTFSKIFPSNEFEQCYPPISLTIDENEETISKSTRSRKRLRTSSIDEDDIFLAQRCSTQFRNPTKKLRKTRRRKRSSTSDDDTTSSDDDNDYLLSEESIINDDDDDDSSSNEPIQSARTAQTLAIIPNCLVCQTNNHPEVLLLCDDCNDAYHTECLHPNLLAIPHHHWSCPLCEQKQLIQNLISKYEQKPTIVRRKIKVKEYSSDESLTASDCDDDQQVTEFSLQLPKQITRLIHRCDRANVKYEQPPKISSIKTNSDSNESIELNEKLDSPLVYVDFDGPVRQMKSVVTNSKQTSKIVRRWNDVQRRSRLKASQMKISTSDDLLDENSNFPTDDLSTINSNNFEIKIDEDQLNTFNNSILSSKNLVRKLDANFDRLTRDIQGAINNANVSSIKSTDQQSNKRNSKKFFSPFVCKTIVPINISDNHHSNIFKIDDCSLGNSSLDQSF